MVTSLVIISGYGERAASGAAQPEEARRACGEGASDEKAVACSSSGNCGGRRPDRTRRSHALTRHGRECGGVCVAVRQARPREGSVRRPPPLFVGCNVNNDDHEFVREHLPALRPDSLPGGHQVGPLKDFTFYHQGCFKCLVCGTKLTLRRTSTTSRVRRQGGVLSEPTCPRPDRATWTACRWASGGAECAKTNNLVNDQIRGSGKGTFDADALGIKSALTKNHQQHHEQEYKPP
ncbi:hypothetical protein HPB52_015170 [Rhipicephalus sanguineus]|uniref:LIM zinc-binding domain-containing protein n=1 Tax=Rhipicephalus sanguineus TaxID=34632 RepID=A0A9D4PBP3_RHISA|nr:hypothetical protein HPB52_015170 [Rhipicephalus sanguineus]